MLGFRTLVLVAALLPASCVVGNRDHGADSPSTVPDRVVEDVRYDERALAPGGRWIATATVPVVGAYAAPGDAQPVHQLPNPDANGTPLVFLVETTDASGDWLPVMLPVRPNGTTGWIRAGEVALSQTQMRIKIDLTAHTLKIYEGRGLRLESPIGVGKESTPTPAGKYYIKELIRPPDPTTVYGPYVFGLSGFSDVLTSLDGLGEGRIGLHGNNDGGSIGKNVSSGCIRLPNEVVTQMTEFLPLGTPVEIVEPPA